MTITDMFHIYITHDWEGEKGSTTEIEINDMSCT